MFNAQMRLLLDLSSVVSVENKTTHGSKKKCFNDTMNVFVAIESKHI